MWTKAIILCNGIDDSLLDVDLTPFTYGTVSPHDVKPIEEKGLSYIYNQKDPDGKIVNVMKEKITVDTLYDFFHHLFAPLSTASRFYFDYTVKKKADGTFVPSTRNSDTSR